MIKEKLTKVMLGLFSQNKMGDVIGLIIDTMVMNNNEAYKREGGIVNIYERKRVLLL